MLMTTATMRSPFMAGEEEPHENVEPRVQRWKVTVAFASQIQGTASSPCEYSRYELAHAAWSPARALHERPWRRSSSSPAVQASSVQLAGGIEHAPVTPAHSKLPARRGTTIARSQWTFGNMNSDDALSRGERAARASSAQRAA